jgi:hypothetical protein
VSMLVMSRRSDFPSKNGCVDPFAATAGALVGARVAITILIFCARPVQNGIQASGRIA